MRKLVGLAIMVVGGAWVILVGFRVVRIEEVWAMGVASGIGLLLVALGVQVFRSPPGVIA